MDNFGTLRFRDTTDRETVIALVEEGCEDCGAAPGDSHWYTCSLWDSAYYTGGEE